MSDSPPWYVYILKCSDNSLYTGITTDLDRRLHEHNHGNQAARYTRVRRPVELAYAETAESRSNACKREHEIKQLSVEKKRLLVAKSPIEIPG